MNRLANREDFALQPVPPTARRPVAPLFSVMLAIPSALVFFAVGGALGQAYGTAPLITGLIVASVIIGGAGWALTSFAARTGLDSDLISIRAGFGLAGSAITSAIYSVNFIVLYVLEAAIVVSAVHARYPDIPRAALLLALGLLVLTFAWYGISSLSKFMAITVPLFLGLIVVAVTQVGGSGGQGSFWAYDPPGGVDVTAWLSVLAALLAFIVNATVAADVGRFLPVERRGLGSFLFGGVLQVIVFGGSTLLGAWISFRLGGDAAPGDYLVGILGGWGLLCVLLSQIRINMINAYSGSLSLANFGARGLGLRPGRHVWMIGLVVVSSLLALVDVSSQLVKILTFESVFVMAWVATLVSYIAWFDLDEDQHLGKDWLDGVPRLNVVGIGALSGSLVIATPLAFGIMGELGKALAPMVAMGVAPVGVIVLARLVSRPASEASLA